MEIRLLGPFEAWRDGARVDLGAPKQRAVLAQLAIEAGDAVSTDRLIDGVWPDQPPRTASKSLQVYISNLRSILGPPAIVTEGSRYRLVIEADAIDARRFERLVNVARWELGRGHHDVAIASLRQALALWRGRALEDFGIEEYAQDLVARLDDLRLEAVELLYRAELDAGRGPELVRDIEQAVREQPLREGLRGLLMQALYQAGRQADALATYREGRRLLDAELGIDPAPELQRLERSILLQEAGLLTARGELAPAVEAERKIATVAVLTPDGVMVDDPERSIARLERFSRVVLGEIARAGGTPEWLGDGGIRGIFGAPVAQTDHLDRAIEAALRASTALASDAVQPLAVRAGIASGEIVFALAPDGGLLVVGTPTSEAARLARAIEPGQVAVTLQSVKAASRYQFGPPRPLIDDLGPMTFANVQGSAEGASPRTGSRRGRFVGRQRELEELADLYRRVVEDRAARVVVVVGDAGIGKTSLVEAAWARLAGAAESPRRLVGRCVSYGEARTYRPVADMLRTFLDVRESDPSEEVLRRLGDRQILALTLGIDVAQEAHPLTAAEELQAAWQRLVGDLIAERPLILTFEDLHWADEILLDFIARLAGGAHGPLLILATARPEFVDRWNTWGAARPGFEAHWLEPLSASDAKRLLTARLGPGASAPLRAVVLARAEGNPFFIEELVGSLHDAGPGQAAAISGEGGQEHLPDSITATVGTRIDLLPTEVKATLHAASVIGREFWAGALESAVSPSGLSAGVVHALDVLVERDFIRRRPQSAYADEAQFTFKHAIIRDVAFQSLPATRRAPLHGSFATWLLRRNGGRDEDAPILAYHFGAAAMAATADRGKPPERIADLRAEAVHWLERAANLAIGRYELDSAERLLRDALGLTTDRDTQRRLWRLLAEIGYLRYDGDGFWAAMQQALDLAEERADQAELYGLLAEVTALRLGMWLQAPRQSLIDGWIDQALALASPRSLGRARALVARAWMSATFGEDVDRQADIGEALAVAEALDDSQLLAHALGLEVRHDLFMGDYGRAEAVTSQLVALAADIDNPDEQALILQQGVAFLTTLGALGEAARLARRFEALTDRLSPHHRVHSAAAEVLVRYLSGSNADVLAMAPIVRQRMADSLSTPCFSGPFSLLMCANAALRAGDDAAADGLEDDVAAAMMEGYGLERDPLRIRASVLRGDLVATRALMETPLRDHWDANWLSAVVPEYIDGLIAVAEPERIRAEVERFLTPGSVFAPFARRALGIVAGDAEGVRAADAELIARGLTTAAADTPRLVTLYAGRQPPASQPVRVPSH